MISQGASAKVPVPSLSVLSPPQPGIMELSRMGWVEVTAKLMKQRDVQESRRAIGTTTLNRPPIRKTVRY
jgi:hypothetical protein